MQISKSRSEYEVSNELKMGLLGINLILFSKKERFQTNCESVWWL